MLWVTSSFVAQSSCPLLTLCEHAGDLGKLNGGVMLFTH